MFCWRNSVLFRKKEFLQNREMINPYQRRYCRTHYPNRLITINAQVKENWSHGLYDPGVWNFHSTQTRKRRNEWVANEIADWTIQLETIWSGLFFLKILFSKCFKIILNFEDNIGAYVWDIYITKSNLIKEITWLKGSGLLFKLFLWVNFFNNFWYRNRSN